MAPQQRDRRATTPPTVLLGQLLHRTLKSPTYASWSIRRYTLFISRGSSVYWNVQTRIGLNKCLTKVIKTLFFEAKLPWDNPFNIGSPARVRIGVAGTGDQSSIQLKKGSNGASDGNRTRISALEPPSPSPLNDRGTRKMCRASSYRWSLFIFASGSSSGRRKRQEYSSCASRLYNTRL